MTILEFGALREFLGSDARYERPHSLIRNVPETRSVANSTDHQPEIATFRALVRVTS